MYLASMRLSGMDGVNVSLYVMQVRCGIYCSRIKVKSRYMKNNDMFFLSVVQTIRNIVSLNLFKKITRILRFSF